MDNSLEPQADKPLKEHEIFLQEALQEQFSFKRLDQALIVISRKDWIAYLVVFCLLCLFILWCFFGSIPVNISGKGMILDLNQIATVQSTGNGFVTHIHATEGESVKPGQLLLELHDPLIAFEYEFYQMLLDIVQKEYDQLASQINAERIFRSDFLDQQSLSLQFARENKGKEIDILKETMATEQGLLEKNLLTLSTVNRTRLEFLAAQTEIKNIEARLKETAFQHSINYRQEEIWSKEATLNETKRLLENARIQYLQTLIFSPDHAKVISNLAYSGLAVSKGMPLFILQKSKDPIPPRYFYAYISVDVAKGIYPGMAANVELSKYILKKYGYIPGIVKEVTILPVSDANILAKLYNPSLVASLKSASVVQIIIELKKDPLSPSGYHWSSGKGPLKPITIGNVGIANLVIDRIMPVYFLLPNWVHKDEGCLGD